MWKESKLKDMTDVVSYERGDLIFVIQKRAVIVNALAKHQMQVAPITKGSRKVK